MISSYQSEILEEQARDTVIAELPYNRIVFGAVQEKPQGEMERRKFFDEV